MAVLSPIFWALFGLALGGKVMQAQSLHSHWGIRVKTSDIQQGMVPSYDSRHPPLLSKLQGLYSDEQRMSFTMQSTMENKLDVVTIGKYSWVVGPQLKDVTRLTNFAEVEGIHYSRPMQHTSTPFDLWGMDRILSRKVPPEESFLWQLQGRGRGASTCHSLNKTLTYFACSARD
jgi:hypothetical protein